MNLGVWVDPSMSDWYILQGIAIWAPLGAVAHIAADRNDADARFTPVFDGCPDNPISRMGWTAENTHESFVRMDCLALMPDPNMSLMTLSAHEFGHQIGLPHIPDDQSLMFRSPDLWNFPTLTQSDRAEFCRVWDCSP